MISHQDRRHTPRQLAAIGGLTAARQDILQEKNLFW